MTMEVARDSGAAMRRRQRRLRSWWRHEQQSIAAALATFQHHSAQRPKTARAGEEDHEVHYTAAVRTHPLPQAAGTQYFELSDEDVVPARGSRPACLVAPRGPQEAVQRHTVEQLADIVPMVQVLDDPGLLGEVGVLGFFQELDLLIPEQVIVVPKFFLPRIARRRPRRRPQRAEQLVEVPTIISYSLLQRDVEQTIDIPVHDRGGRGGGGGLQGFSQGQASSAFRGAEFVDIPVPPGRGGLVGGGLQSFSQGQGSTAFYGADHAGFPVLPGRVGGGGLQGFLPGQGSATSSSHVGSAEEAGYGGIRTFSRPGKSAKLGPHSGSELGADFTPSTPALYVDGDMPPTWIDGDGLTWWQSASGRWYKARDPSIWWDAPG